VDSPYGTIASRWRTEGRKVRIEVTVPPNTRATLYLPAENAAAIRESGRLVAAHRTAGIAELVVKDRLATLRLQPGRYSFETGLLGKLPPAGSGRQNEIER
jgi:alpha-L-rhamnosidase